MAKLLINNELAGCGREQLWPNLKHYPGTWLREIRKNMKPCQGFWSLTQNLNQGPANTKQ